MDYKRGKNRVCSSCKSLAKLNQGNRLLIQGNKLLLWHIRELEQGNPVPRREDNVLSDVRRDYTEGALDEV